MSKKLLAEYLGTFTLAFGVVASLYSGAIYTPFLAAIILGIFVYTIGWLSGCHLNPAVTIGLLSIKRMKVEEAVMYILAQVAAGISVLLLVYYLGWKMDPIAIPSTRAVFMELFGMTLFAFGIGMVVLGKVDSMLSGAIVGASLFLGLTFALLGGAAAILNPAVAVGLKTDVVAYYLIDIAGGILGFQIASFLGEEKPWWKEK